MRITPYVPFLTIVEKEMPFNLPTIGASLTSSHTYRPHGIADCQILYIDSGAGRVVINNTTHELKEKSILYLPPNTAHNYYSTTEKWNTKYITFSGSGTVDFAKMPACIIDTTNFDFQKWYKILYKYKYTPNHEKSLSITLYAALLDFKSCMSFSSSTSETKKNMYMSAIYKMANNHALTIDDITKQLNVSKEHFCRTFKNYTGFRPLEYVNFLKIQQAKEMLKNTDISISDIAKLSGYVSSSYFTMLFKRYTDTTPQQYRKL